MGPEPSYPIKRLHRLRQNKPLRLLIQENQLSVSNLIYPMFVTYGTNKKQEIGPMPGCYQFSIDKLLEELSDIYGLGIPGILLFGIPDYKDDLGRGAYAKDGIIQTSIRKIKDRFPDLLIISDVCLCEYTNHGHCGLLKDSKINNDETLTLLAQAALSHAQSGADIVAPSAMMDGQVHTIRNILDSNGYTQTPIMSYAVKYASAFYGPFRVAAESSPNQGDRSTYQLNTSNTLEAFREISSDIQEGADIVIIKPGLPYLDIVAKAKDHFNIPIAAYNVSGEYAMFKAATKLEWLESQNALLEIATAFKRAGADIIITYHAKELARLLAV